MFLNKKYFTFLSFYNNFLALNVVILCLYWFFEVKANGPPRAGVTSENVQKAMQNNFLHTRKNTYNI